MTDRDELTALWQQDSDLAKLEHFFHALDPSVEDKERIKQLTLAKLNSPAKAPVPLPKKTVLDRLKYGKAKYGVAVAAICLVTIIGALDNPIKNSPEIASPERMLSEPLNQDMIAFSEPQTFQADEQLMASTSDALMAEDTQEMIAFSALAEEPMPTYRANIVLEVHDPEEAIKLINLSLEKFNGRQLSNPTPNYLEVSFPLDQFELFTTELEHYGVIKNLDTVEEPLAERDSETEHSQYLVQIELVPQP